MEQNKTSSAQARARDKWNKENKEKRKIYTAKSACKRYIRDFADKGDLEEVKDWIKEKENKLKKL